MLMATLSILSLLFTHAPMFQIWAFDLCVLIFVLVDTVRRRRLHPAFVWGGALLIGSFHLTAVALAAIWWLPFVDRVFS
jgi:hypothetical protein